LFVEAPDKRYCMSDENTDLTVKNDVYRLQNCIEWIVLTDRWVQWPYRLFIWPLRDLCWYSGQTKFWDTRSNLRTCQ